MDHLQTLSAAVWRLRCSSKTWLPKTLFSPSCLTSLYCSDTSSPISWVISTQTLNFPLVKTSSPFLLQQQLFLKQYHKHTTSLMYQSSSFSLFHKDDQERLTLAPSLHRVPSGLWASIFVSPCSPLLRPPSGRGLGVWGLFINKSPLFHTPLDVRLASTWMPNKEFNNATMATKTKQNKKKTFCSVSGLHVQKQL